MLWAVGITGLVLVMEAVGGVLSGSLALLSDAGHMLTDLAALLISLTAMILAARPASSKHTFGFARLEVLAAMGNAFTFFLMVLGVVWEALQRLSHPTLPDWRTMGAVAAMGFTANLLSAWFLHGAHEDDINVQSAWIHVLGDLASSLGVLLGVAVIALKGWTWVDPVLSLGIGVLIAWSSFKLFRKAFHILLEAAPHGVTPERIAALLKQEVPEIKEVHHVHLWEVGSGEIHLTAHLVVEDRMLGEGLALISKASAVLREKMSVAHSTLQLETPARMPVLGPKNPEP
jgi:cobalt-zinc-cadmium efflux system protein